MLADVFWLLPNLNDTFAYACADSEKIDVGEGEIMAAWWRRHGWHGLVALAAWKRQRHPLSQVAAHPSYQTAIADLRSDETIACAGEVEGATWLWWFFDDPVAWDGACTQLAGGACAVSRCETCGPICGGEFAGPNACTCGDPGSHANG
jgi:hypothetical protein